MDGSASQLYAEVPWTKLYFLEKFKESFIVTGKVNVLWVPCLVFPLLVTKCFFLSKFLLVCKWSLETTKSHTLAQTLLQILPFIWFCRRCLGVFKFSNLLVLGHYPAETAPS